MLRLPGCGDELDALGNPCRLIALEPAGVVQDQKLLGVKVLSRSCN